MPRTSAMTRQPRSASRMCASIRASLHRSARSALAPRRRRPVTRSATVARHAASTCLHQRHRCRQVNLSARSAMTVVPRASSCHSRSARLCARVWSTRAALSPTLLWKRPLAAMARHAPTSLQTRRANARRPNTATARAALASRALCACQARSAVRTKASTRSTYMTSALRSAASRTSNASHQARIAARRRLRRCSLSRQRTEASSAPCLCASASKAAASVSSAAAKPAYETMLSAASSSCALALSSRDAAVATRQPHRAAREAMMRCSLRRRSASASAADSVRAVARHARTTRAARALPALLSSAACRALRRARKCHDSRYARARPRRLLEAILSTEPIVKRARHSAAPRASAGDCGTGAAYAYCSLPPTPSSPTSAPHTPR